MERETLTELVPESGVDPVRERMMAGEFYRAGMPLDDSDPPTRCRSCGDVTDGPDSPYCWDCGRAAQDDADAYYAWLP